jgi:hypothetical protein
MAAATVNIPAIALSDSLFRIVDGTTDHVMIDAARWRRSSQ